MAGEPWLAPALGYAVSWLGFQREQLQQPGFAVAVAHEGRIVLDHAEGEADLATGEALTPRHRMRIASHSKSFTAAAILALVEEGRLRLDDRCGAHVEGLHPSVGAATIGQLLSHSGGVTRDGPDSGQFLDRVPYRDRDQLIAELSDPSPVEPGMRFKYSNHGYGLLGLVVERVTGAPYAEWVAARILRPAALTETTPDIDGAAGAPLASGHSGRRPLGRRVVIPGRNPTRAMAAAAGFVSTASDVARFFAQLDPAAETSVLSVASRREMVRRHWRDDEATLEQHYGLGTVVGPPGPFAHFGHSGGFQGFITKTLVVFEAKLAISVLTNAADGAAHVWAEGVLRILRRFRESGAPPAGREGWRGRYWSLWGAVDLVAVGERVLANPPAVAAPFYDASEIEVTGPDEGRIAKASGFGSPGEPVRLVRGADGAVEELRIAGAHLRPEAAAVAEMEERYGGRGVVEAPSM